MGHMRVRELRVEVALALYSASFLPQGPQWPVVTLLCQVGRSWVSDSQVPGLMSRLLWCGTLQGSLWNAYSAVNQPNACPADRVRGCFWRSAVRHFRDMHGGVNAGDAGPFYDLRFRNFVLLPSDMEKSAEEAQVELWLNCFSCLCWQSSTCRRREE